MGDEHYEHSPTFLALRVRSLRLHCPFECIRGTLLHSACCEPLFFLPRDNRRGALPFEHRLKMYGVHVLVLVLWVQADRNELLSFELAQVLTHGLFGS